MGAPCALVKEASNGSHLHWKVAKAIKQMCWIPNKHKGFMVRDFYKILVGNTLLGFPWKSIWKQKIPSRVVFFVWTAALGKCLTIDNLWKRKVWILD